MVKVAIDCYSASQGPFEIGKGVIAAALEHPTHHFLVAVTPEFFPLFGPNLPSNMYLLEGVTSYIESEEVSLAVFRQHPKASIRVAMQAVRDGVVDVAVGFGNRAAQVLAAHHHLEPVWPKCRPAIATFFPQDSGEYTILLDCGAMPNPQPANLVDFARLGFQLSHSFLKHPRPMVGLMCNGTEDWKGSTLIRCTDPLLREQFGSSYMGRIEPESLFSGEVQVIVGDGCTLNILLKGCEATYRASQRAIKAQLQQSWLGKAVGLPLRQLMQPVKQRFDAGEIGSAPLLGTNGLVVSGHGSSNALAVQRACGFAIRYAQQMRR